VRSEVDGGVGSSSEWVSMIKQWYRVSRSWMYRTWEGYRWSQKGFLHGWRRVHG